MQLPPHPRLIVTSATWLEMRARRKQSPVFDRYLQKMESDGRALLDATPVEYRMEGRRLLSVCREAFRRIVLWSLDYHITGDKKFRDRAEQEMLAVAAFADWNPGHFLDTGEMTAGVALGYDWLHDELSPATRATIREAIIEKGLKPGLDLKASINWWYTHENNWNQVCLGGLVLGALCVAEQEPALAEQTLANARTYIPNGLKPYAPDGVYPEGPGYWSYGTTYQVILLAALETALGTDWNLCQSPGFKATANYPQGVTGPTQMVYPYSDSGELVDVTPALYWFARKFQDPDILYFQHQYLPRFIAGEMPQRSDPTENRFLPFLAIWAGDVEAKRSPTGPLNWYGDGVVPLVVFRSSWSDPDALFLALKAGAASANHGHMDAGSFILDADGVRWARDLGAQGYQSIESKGVNLWDNSQEGQRWTVFRLNNFSHNTLTINGQLHHVKGRSEVIRCSGDSATPHTVIDLSPVFTEQAGKVVRGFKLLPNRQVLIQDELSGLQPNDLVRWAFVTDVEVSIEGSHATLRKNGKTLQAALTTSVGGNFEVIPAEPSEKDDFNEPNPGTSILIANLRAPASGKLVIQVLLQPGKAPLSQQSPEMTPCEDWSAPLPAKTP